MSAQHFIRHPTRREPRSRETIGSTIHLSTRKFHHNFVGDIAPTDLSTDTTYKSRMWGTPSSFSLQLLRKRRTGRHSLYLSPPFNLTWLHQWPLVHVHHQLLTEWSANLQQLFHFRTARSSSSTDTPRVPSPYRSSSYTPSRPFFTEILGSIPKKQRPNRYLHWISNTFVCLSSPRTITSHMGHRCSRNAQRRSASQSPYHFATKLRTWVKYIKNITHTHTHIYTKWPQRPFGNDRDHKTEINSLTGSRREFADIHTSNGG